jgi:thiamine-monophosphate kinase
MLGGDDARFVKGLEEALSFYDAPLLGGDTVAGKGPQSLGLTAIGKPTHRPVPCRSGAAAGDLLYVTGAIGAAMTGFEALQSGNGDSLAYRRPVALLAQGQALAPHVTAMMDISDGLLLDACRLAEASKVALSIDSSCVPIAAAEDRRGDAMRWGDDYQLLFTAPADMHPPVPATCIGQALELRDAPLLLDGEPLDRHANLGYEH